MFRNRYSEERENLEDTRKEEWFERKAIKYETFSGIEKTEYKDEIFEDVDANIYWY